MRSARVLGVLLALCAALPADAREFRSSDIYPFDYPTVQAVVQVDKLMRERSGGKLGITVLGYDDRDSENYTAAQVRNGQLDMARDQSRRIEQPRSVDGDIRPSLSLQVEGTHAAHSRRADRRGDPRRPGRRRD